MIPDGWSKVANVDDDRTNLFLEVRLVAEVTHPRTAAFALSRVVIGDEDTQMRTVGVLYFEDLSVWVIEFHAVHFGECHTEESIGDSEGSLLSRLETEVRFQIFFVERVLLGSNLFGVVPPVTAGDLEVTTFRVRNFLHVGDFLFRSSKRWLPKLHQQFVNLGWFLRHVLFEDVMSVRGVT